MEVHQHVLLEGRLAVVDADGVVVSVETMDQGLNRGLVEVAQVGCTLARLLTKHEGLRVDQAEGINDDLSLDGLDGIDDDGDGSWGKLLEALLGVDIDTGQPATETRMRVVPSDDRFGPVYAVLSVTVLLVSTKTQAQCHGGVFCHTFPFASASPSSSSGKQGRLPRH